MNKLKNIISFLDGKLAVPYNHDTVRYGINLCWNVIRNYAISHKKIIIIVSLVTLSLVVFFIEDWRMKTHNMWQTLLINGQEIAGITVQHIEVTGTHYINKADVVAISGIHHGMPLLALDLYDIRQRILSNSWVDNVEVFRVLPQKIQLIVKEKQPFALYNDGANIFVMDKKGQLLAMLQDNRMLDKILVSGRDAPEHYFEFYKYVAQHMAAVIPYITSMHYVEERRWDIVISQHEKHIYVQLPALRYIDDNIGHDFFQNMTSMVEHGDIFAKNIAAIDYRNPRQAIITFKIIEEQVSG